MQSIYLEDSWLAAQIQKPAFRLDPSAAVTLSSLSTEPEGAHFTFGKVAVAEVEAVNALLKSNFRYINTQVTLKKYGTDKMKSSQAIRHATSDDKARIWTIAHNAYSYDRFHQDETLRPFADVINASWATNFFSGNRGTDMLVHEIDGTVTGFILLIIEDGIFDIDLIAVDKHYKRRGIANQLVATAEAKYAESTEFSVITQLNNLPAIQMYGKLGYIASELDFVFHKHQA